MAWYNFWQNNQKIVEVEEKLNPAQEDIVMIEGHGEITSKEIVSNYTSYYEYLEVVNRGVNMIVDDTAEIPLLVKEQLGLNPVVKGMRRSRLQLMLNKEPNPFQDISTFKRNLIVDFILDGNIFIYFDGSGLYHLPANYMAIEPHEKQYVDHYSFQGGNQNFSTDEIIHIKENSFYSIYRGTSRLRPASRTMSLLTRMRNFQDNYFKNGAVPGLVIKSPNTLSERIKERMVQSWVTRYRPDNGGRRPLILDGGMELDEISNLSFREMDFQKSIVDNESEVLKALGIPPILLDSGNNANIRPNHRLYYLETILPIVRKINFALERFFGFEIKEDISNIPALQPELRDAASYYSSLVNGGIMTVNEAREALAYEPLDGQDDIRAPANIAGSAVNPDLGGRPESEETPEDA